MAVKACNLPRRSNDKPCGHCLNCRNDAELLCLERPDWNWQPQDGSSMTPHSTGNRARGAAFQMASNECANFVTSMHPPFRGCVLSEKGECILSTPGKRCRYFEKCVLPLVEPKWNRPQYAEVRNQYMRDIRKAGKIVPKDMTEGDIRRCECGTPLAVRKRFCPKCLKQRGRENRRQAASRFRNKSASNKSTILAP